MGNAAYRQTTANPNMDQDLKTFMQSDLPRFVWQDKIGNGKFMKTFVMRVESTQLVVKVYMKLAEDDLQQAATKLTNIWKVLSPTKFPSLMPYQMWLRSTARVKTPNTPVYLVRQYFNTNLSDRISTRPFLNELEKYWIVYQLLKCLELCHENKIIHGDIKPENVMCTTSNWIILTDFAPFKPCFIPDDDPTDFQFYFDTMARHKCYLAPERFHHKDVSKGKTVSAPLGGTHSSIPQSNSGLTGINSSGSNLKSRSRSLIYTANASGIQEESLYNPAMDVFSLGCVIAEVLLDGTPLFDLPSMLQYLSSSAEGLGTSPTPVTRSREEEETSQSNSYLKVDQDESPAKQIISRIKNHLIRGVLIDMTQKDPEKRLPASEYLKILFGNVEKFQGSYGLVSSSLPEASLVSGRSSTNKLASLNSLSHSPFPLFFENCIYPLYLKLHWNGVTPDDRIIIICETYDHLMEKITGEEDLEGSHFFRLSVENNSRLLSSALTMDMRSQSSLLLPLVSQQLNAIGDKFSETEGRGSPLKLELLKQAREATGQEVLLSAREEHFEIGSRNLLNAKSSLEARIKFLQDLPRASSIPQNKTVSGAGADEMLKMKAIQEMFSHTKSKAFFKVSWDEGHRRPCYEGLVLIADLLCSNYRHLKYLTSRVTCLMMLGRIGRLCVDSVILQRIIPLLLAALEDSYSLIKITALRILTALTSIVEEFDPIEVNFFPQYIFPNLGRISRDNELIVRIAFAECMGTLALTAKHFLDRGHSIFLHKAVSDAITSSQDINKLTIEFPYDQKLELLKDQVARWIRDIVADINNSSSSSSSNMLYKSQKNSAGVGTGSIGGSISSSPNSVDSSVKKVILQHIMELCAFFGQESTMEKLLTQLLTFPNDQDWELRCAFCMKIPTVAAFLGTTVTSEYIVPCLENTIYDVEEKVSLSTIVAITALVRMRLISKYLIVDFIQKCKSLLIHSSRAIREASIQLFVVASETIGEAATAASILPEIQSILRYPLFPAAISADHLRLSVVPPLSRDKIRLALWTKLKEQAGSSNINLNELLYTAVIPVADQSSPEIIVREGKEGLTEDERIQFTSSYLNNSAREIFNKSLRWRAITRPTNNGSNSANQHPSLRYSPTGYLASSPTNSSKLNSSSTAGLNRFLQNSITSSLVWTHLPALENNVFCFQIPHIKSATSISEEWRKQSIFLDFDEIKNQQKIRYFFMGSLPILRGIDYSHRSLVVNSGDVNTVLDDAYTIGNVASNSGVIFPNPATSGNTNSPIPSKGVPQQTAGASNIAENYNHLANTLTTVYSNSSFRFATSFGTNSISLLRRLKALDIPPLPVEMGSLVSTAEERINTETSDVNPVEASYQKSSWKPKEGVLLLTLREHKSAVNRLVISPDQSYFASASTDRTVRVWQTRSLDKLGYPRSSAVYKCHQGPVTDAAVIDNTHSIASVSKDGSVHVWRVDMQSGAKAFSDATASANPDIPNILQRSTAVVSGTSVIRTIDSSEGEILSVQHFNSDVASIVTFATQRGGIHGWDLRMPQEVFKYSLRPELGYVTSMTVSPDKSFICAGTSKGYLALWDVRYNILTQAWRHSSLSAINRLASGRAIRSTNQNLSGLPPTDGAYLFVASGENEAAVFGLPEAGECLKCFRSLSLDDNKAPIAPLPRLEEIALPRHPSGSLSSSILANDRSPSSVNSYSVKAMLGRISPNNASYLITAGTDKHIRFWDFRSSEACYTVAGLELTQLKSIYRKLDEKSAGKLFVCYTPTVPASDKILQSHLPVREGRGLTTPSTNFKDAILDLKDIDYPMKFLLASSRDGEIKVWR